MSRFWNIIRILLVPILLFGALATWAVASPVGSAPDDDFHLASIWCAQGDQPGRCEATSSETHRMVPAAIAVPPCYRDHPDITSICAGDLDAASALQLQATRRGNFTGAYPPVFYAAMSIFIQPKSIPASVVVMRLVNAALFVALATALYWLLPLRRRSTLVLSMTATFIPLGIFLIPSVNPSGWAIASAGTLWLALVGCFETTGARRWGLAALSAVSAVMGAGSRGDAGLFVAVGAVLAIFLAWRRSRSFWNWPVIILCAAIIAAGLWSAFGTGMGTGAATGGFGTSSVSAGAAGSTTSTTTAATPGQEHAGIGLLFWNLINVPSLWLGSLGTWGLGWFDVTLPWIVPACTIVVFGFVLLWGMRDSTPRKIIAMTGGVVLLTALPLVILQKSHVQVGTEVQPRYLLPLLTMLVAVALFRFGRRIRSLTLTQRILIAALAAVANGASLGITVLRYTLGLGTRNSGFNPSRGTVWWWSHLVPTPDIVIALGVVLFACAIFALMLWGIHDATELGAAEVAAADAASDETGTRPGIATNQSTLAG
ncbi:hypothetical protein GCM10022286_28900 [Gryllotalpicola daejeonensis]|uniref:DUF2142 domain-containing protein n=1 Tax=Gryllotalpicola daejeonensis TaxID=993087 RepID=A0ABP7ZN88_9MICO